MTTTATTASRPPSRFSRAIRSLNDRRMLAMLILAFAASIPYGAVIGALTAWLTEEGVKTDKLGVLALVTLGYSFKYLWAPLFQIPRDVPFLKIGGRRSWLVLCQALMAVLLIALCLQNPAENLSMVALICFVITLIGPTHDIVLDAWRIEVARSDEDKDLMSALYQFGYKSGGFVSGFLALLIAARQGWVVAYVMMAAFVALTIIGSLIAPEPHVTPERARSRLSFLPTVKREDATPAVIAIVLSWASAFYLIGQFVLDALVFQKPVKGSQFVADSGPLIVLLTVIAPTALAALLLVRNRANAVETPVDMSSASASDKILSTLFRAIFDPMMDLIFRLRFWVVLVIALALTYRFTDAVWGSFAYPFYLRTDLDGLGHSLDDIAIASKFVGVLATILGSLIGAIMIATSGRMPVFVIGAIVAAVTNLLYADLAANAAVIDGFLNFTRLDVPLGWVAEQAAKLQPKEIIIPPDQGQRMARLMTVIFAENIAGGFALVAMTAYLTSIVNPRFAAVQYALLASLTMLIGTLGRPLLGQMIEQGGFGPVFVWTFWLGGVAVALSLLEWWRQSRETVRVQTV